MKFNREQLLSKLQTKIASAEADYAEDLAAWNRELAVWEVSVVRWQTAQLAEQYISLTRLQNQLAQTATPLKYSDLPLVPAIAPYFPDAPEVQRYSTDLKSLLPTDPFSLNGHTRPTALDLRGVQKLISFLTMATDVEVSSSALAEYGFKDIVRMWL